MMRTYLTISSMLLLWVFIGPARAQNQEPVLPANSFPRPDPGLGETEESAKQNALHNAVNALEHVMQQQNPPLVTFKPSAQYVRDHLLTDAGRPGKEIRIPLNGVDDPFKVKEWIVTFRTDYNWWAPIVKLDREMARKNRAEAHQAMTFGGIVGLSALLFTGFGYVRLNELTRRRYITSLRVAGASIAAIVIAGLWLLFQGG